MATQLTIRAAVGAKPAPNKPEDVKKVQVTLNAVKGRTVIPATGKCDQKTIDAIGDFQKLWPGRTDNRVDPNGRTVKRLNQTLSPLKITKIKRSRIKHGGYIISYSGELPPKGYSVHLAIGPGADSIDVTKRRPSDLLGADNLPSFLKLIERKKLWGVNAECRLSVKHEGHLISRSEGKMIPCPVQPYQGVLEPGMGQADGGPKYTYTGIQTGRMIYQPAIDGKFYFAYGGRFETKNSMRGLNCITYVGAVFGVDPSSQAMSSYGTQLADHIGATKCDMENKKESDIKEFFKNRKGTYIMWSSSHCVLVVDGIVHEFAQSKNGYGATDVQKWNFHGKSYWTRKCLKDF